MTTTTLTPAQVAANVRGHLISALERHGDHAQGYIVVSRIDGSGGYWYSGDTYRDFGDENAVIKLGSFTANKIRRATDASILEDLLGYESVMSVSATQCISMAHALHLLQVWGGWIIDQGDCIWHTDDEGAAVDLVLPMAQEDRERAHKVVTDPRLADAGYVINSQLLNWQWMTRTAR